MPYYLIEQYELHGTVYRVEADTEIEALTKFSLSSAPHWVNSDYIEVADAYGMPADKESAKAMKAAGLPVKEIIPGIRAIELDPDQQPHSD